MYNAEFIPPYPLNTAVLFLIFNRLNTTKQVFQAIRQAKPPRLYIAADGPRKNRVGESEAVEVVRNYVINNIDWDCEVKTLFRNKNLGCKYAVSSAITWFFEQEEMGIILEDDCLPTQSFFWFCEELLKKYKDENKIFLISGDGRATTRVNIKEDYSFIKYPLIWGWASWSRSWKYYDVNMTDWKEQQFEIIKKVSKFSKTRNYWKEAFNNIYDNKIDTWDYQWSYTLQKYNGLCIIPRVNMITNIGFGVDATHTKDENNKNANIPNLDLKFPLLHPINITNNESLNKYYDLYEFRTYNIFIRAINKLSRIIIGENVVK